MTVTQLNDLIAISQSLAIQIDLLEAPDNYNQGAELTEPFASLRYETRLLRSRVEVSIIEARRANYTGLNMMAELFGEAGR